MKCGGCKNLIAYDAEVWAFQHIHQPTNPGDKSRVIDADTACSPECLAVILAKRYEIPAAIIVPDVSVLPKLGSEDTLIVRLGASPGEMTTERPWIPTHADLETMQEEVIEITGHPKVFVTHRWAEFEVLRAEEASA